MAAPHVSGLALDLMSLENIKTAAEVVDRLLDSAAGGLIDEVRLKGGSPNLFAYNGGSGSGVEKCE